MPPPWAMVRIRAVVLACLLAAVPAAAAPERPSFFLAVLDTLRYDAVSANGEVAHTTPVLDRLAAAGVRYTHAYANASWTLPSHASLFTGLLPSAHGVGWHRTVASNALVTLAEALRDAGWETVCVSENPWVSARFNLMQGCEHQQWVLPGVGLHALEYVREWAGRRDRTRPFFVFLNLVDAHSPYRVEEHNAFVPCCFADDALAALPTHARAAFCRTAAHGADLRAQHGLYLNGVTRADEKLGAVHAVLGAAGGTAPLVTLVTSDHGEHFGEHDLVDHLIGVYQELIHVPLVLHGLPGLRPAVVDEAVSLLDVMPSVLAWAGVAPPRPLSGQRLPTSRGAGTPARVVLAEWDDPGADAPAEDPLMAGRGRRLVQEAQAQCAEPGRVRGIMRAGILLPHKLIWRERAAPELYDLARDPQEALDLGSRGHPMVSLLKRVLEQQIAAAGPPPPRALVAPPPPSPEMLERLRTLGYVEDASD